MTKMKRDLRDTPEFHEAEEIVRRLNQPGVGLIIDALEIDVSSDGSLAVITGVVMDNLEEDLRRRICLVDLRDGTTRPLTFGPNADHGCRFSPDGKSIAFLSDRANKGDFQLYLLDMDGRAGWAAPRVDGWIEYLHWSADGSQILLGVAGHGADASCAHGAVTSKQSEVTIPLWMPNVEVGDEEFRRRSVWIYDLRDDRVMRIPTPDINVWEANWCGPDSVVAVTSPDADEGAWYSASLDIIDKETGRTRRIYESSDQIGWSSADPAGTKISVVEAVCSDRWVVAGELRIIEVQTGQVKSIPTNGADVTHIRWRGPERVFLGAHRGFETVVLEYDTAKDNLTESWSSTEQATGRYFPAAPLGEGVGDCVLIAEGYKRPPEIAAIKDRSYSVVRSLAGPHCDEIRDWTNKVELLSWLAPDGLEIQGWLLLPKGSGPFPLVMHVHGGPVASSRPQWFGKTGVGIAYLMLLERGYAILLPNPRGSSGRGLEYARKVKGDINGKDTYDLLSGLDHLVERGIADPARIGVTGTSYGGNMTSWLITQDQRFAAAVSIATHANQVSQHLVSNIPDFDALFLADEYDNPNGRYFERSAIMHAHKAITPCLNIGGALDRCTPPSQTVEFHNALREHGVKSALVIYPQEGHGVRGYPASIDLAARMIRWFEEHIPRSEHRPTRRNQGELLMPAF
ncbi:S9 family peptidase [Mesorhizobium sp. M0904]|uniref:S9 family peptidase n=1 Tax=Mesorhizobium sp. M0904 TaxID=2957022 RepID=UPI003339C382